MLLPPQYRIETVDNESLSLAQWQY